MANSRWIEDTELCLLIRREIVHSLLLLLQLACLKHRFLFLCVCVSVPLQRDSYREGSRGIRSALLFNGFHATLCKSKLQERAPTGFAFMVAISFHEAATTPSSTFLFTWNKLINYCLFWTPATPKAFNTLRLSNATRVYHFKDKRVLQFCN